MSCNFHPQSPRGHALRAIACADLGLLAVVLSTCHAVDPLPAPGLERTATTEAAKQPRGGILDVGQGVGATPAQKTRHGAA